MKHLKKLASLALALVMVMALAAPAWAAEYEKPELEVKEHDFQVFQIFKGIPLKGQDGNSTTDSFEEDSIAWGDDMTDARISQFVTGLGNSTNDALKAAFDGITLKNGKWDAADVAKRISNAGNTKAVGDAVAEILYPLLKTSLPETNLQKADTKKARETGYYLLVDATVEEGQANKLIMHRHMKHIETGDVIPKTTTTPNLSKKVNGVDVNDVNFDEPLHYEITATLPDGFEKILTKYELTFLDQQHDGIAKLTSAADNNFQVKIVKKDNTPGKTLVLGTDYTLDFDVKANQVLSGSYKADKDYSFVIRIVNMKNTENPSSSFVGLEDGDKIVVSYTTKLDKEYILANGIDATGYVNDVWLDYTDAKDKPHDDTRTYTFELDINKVDGTNNNAALAGAEFSLYRKPTTNENENNVVLDLYKVLKKEKEDGTICVKVSDYDPTNDGEAYDGEWIYVGTPEAEAASETITTESKFVFEGLGVGEYMLVEDEVPTGYNAIEPILFEIQAVYNADGTVANDSFKLVEEGSSILGTTGTLSFAKDVVNNKGTLLPETGGIGTTIFYIVGGVLLVGAVVLLIAKRRTSADEE